MSRPMRTQPVTASPQARMRLAELAEALLQVVGVHDRDDLYLGVYCHEERLAERDHVGRIWHVEYHEGRPFALEGTEVHRFRLPAFRGGLDQLADAPVLDRPATGLDRDRDLGHDSHDYPSPGCGRACPRSPCAWPTGASCADIDREDFARWRVPSTAAALDGLTCGVVGRA